MAAWSTNDPGPWACPCASPVRACRDTPPGVRNVKAGQVEAKPRRADKPTLAPRDAMAAEVQRGDGSRLDWVEHISTFRYTLEVGDPGGHPFERVEVLVDTGATFTVVPAAVLQRLGVAPRERVSFRLADGRVMDRQIGETQVRVEGKTLLTVVVFGGEAEPALLGVYTLERAVLAVDPVRQRLVPAEALLIAAGSASRKLTANVVEVRSPKHPRVI